MMLYTLAGKGVCVWGGGGGGWVVDNRRSKNPTLLSFTFLPPLICVVQYLSFYQC